MLCFFADRSRRSLNFHAKTLQGDEAGAFALPYDIVFVFASVFVFISVFLVVFVFVFVFVVRETRLVR